MNATERRGTEKSSFRDPETGKTIWRLTNSQREDMRRSLSAGRSVQV